MKIFAYISRDNTVCQIPATNEKYARNIEETLREALAQGMIHDWTVLDTNDEYIVGTEEEDDE